MEYSNLNEKMESLKTSALTLFDVKSEKMTRQMEAELAEKMVVGLSTDPLVQDAWVSNVTSFMVQMNQGYMNYAFPLDSLVDSIGTITLPSMFTESTVTEYVPGVSVLPFTDLTPASATNVQLLVKSFYTDSKYATLFGSKKYSFNIILQEQMNMAKSMLKHKYKFNLWNWAAVDASGSLGRSTGTARTNMYGNAAAKAITDADFMLINNYFRLQGFDVPGGIAVLSTSCYNDVLKLIAGSTYSFGLTDEARKNGSVIYYNGWEIYNSVYTPAFSNANTKVAIDAIPVNTNFESSFFFQKGYVGSGSGMLEKFEGDAVDYLSHSRFRIGQMMVAGPVTPVIANKRTGIFTLVEG